MSSPVVISGLVLAGVVLWRPLAGIVVMAVWRLNETVPAGPASMIDRVAIDRH